MASFDRASATEEIRRIVLAYPEASDTGDLAGVGAFMGGIRFGPLDAPEEELHVRTADEAAASYERAVIYYDDGLSHAKHLITNIDVAFAADGSSAQATSTYVVMQARPELALQFICTGGYTDSFERVDGEWKLRERREGMDLTGDMRFHVVHPENFHGR
jgi:hypothetical protein